MLVPAKQIVGYLQKDSKGVPPSPHSEQSLDGVLATTALPTRRRAEATSPPATWWARFVTH